MIIGSQTKSKIQVSRFLKVHQIMQKVSRYASISILFCIALWPSFGFRCEGCCVSVACLHWLGPLTFKHLSVFLSGDFISPVGAHHDGVMWLSQLQIQPMMMSPSHCCVVARIITAQQEHQSVWVCVCVCVCALTCMCSCTLGTHGNLMMAVQLERQHSIRWSAWSPTVTLCLLCLKSLCSLSTLIALPTPQLSLSFSLLLSLPFSLMACIV